MVKVKVRLGSGMGHIPCIVGVKVWQSSGAPGYAWRERVYGAGAVPFLYFYTQTDGRVDCLVQSKRIT